MPITPAQKTSANSTPVPFNVTLTTSGTAQDAATVPVNLKGRVVSLINDGPGPVHVGFDHPATTTDLLLQEGEAYGDGDISISTRISFIDAAGTTPRVRGVVWCGS